MANQETVSSPRHWFRFSFRSLMIAVAVIAFSVVLVQWYLTVRNSKPIDTVIHRFNNEVATHYGRIKLDESPLTTSQVLEILASDHYSLTDASPHYAAIFRRIAKTKRIPNNTTFELLPMGKSKDGTPRFSVAMDITEGIHGYRAIVYEPEIPE